MTHRSNRLPLIILFLLIAPANRGQSQDVVEFQSGARLQGRITNIDKAGKKITFESKIGTRTGQRVYPYSRIHAVTYRGKRYVLNPKTSVNGTIGSGSPIERVERTRTEVLELIDTVGSTLPDWYDSTPLNFPSSLDLSWPDAPKKVWENQKYPGHYVWDVINPNRNRWRAGIKLMHHIVAENKNNRQVQVKAMNQLGTLYASLLEDWPRAAFWWRQAGKGTSGAMGVGGFRVGYEVGLARCYWKLGNKQMAVELLNRSKGTPAIWCELGEHDRALRQAEAARKSWMKENALLICGDVCRHAGWYDKALEYYEQATALPMNDKYKQTIPKAKERILAMQAEQSVNLSRLASGTYKGRSLGYSGMIDVAVSVNRNRITSVKITKHVEKQYYSSLTDIPNQIIQKQSVQGIDATTSATITAEAIIRAAAKALAN